MEDVLVAPIMKGCKVEEHLARQNRRDNFIAVPYRVKADSVAQISALSIKLSSKVGLVVERVGTVQTGSRPRQIREGANQPNVTPDRN